MRARIGALLLVAALAACTPVPAADQPVPLVFSIRAVHSQASPSPLNEVQAGHVHSVYPGGWEAKPLAGGRLAQEGFLASPFPDRFEHGAGAVPGIEAFWIDIGGARIPSDYYYLAARNEAIAALTTNKTCHSAKRRVFANDPPDFSGPRFSPGDYVVSATGTCRTNGRATRWAYVVAAPGFGPLREVGIPTSGLYVVLAVVAGPNSERLLHLMVEGARFGDTTVSQMVRAAGSLQ